jgi:short-subunit dehydrogenase
MNPETVLITGASSGIGLELAHVFAREGYNVVGIAEHDRRLRSAMRGLEHEYGVRAWGLVQDLTSPVAVEKINAFLKAEKITVDVLINNAGFGIFGEFIATDWVDERELIELNIISLTELTKHFSGCAHGYVLCVESLCVEF